MHITNTSRYSNSEVRYLIGFALQSVGRKEVGRVREVRVTDKAHRVFGGRAWNCGDIIVRVGAPEKFPFRRTWKGWPNYEMRDWQEGMVGIAAHEFNHLSQYERQRRSFRRVSRSEMECEQAAKHAVEEFRGNVDRHVACMEQRKNRAAERSVKTKERKLVARSPERKLANLEAALKRWQRKEKLAKTKIRGIRRKMKYYQRKIDAR